MVDLDDDDEDFDYHHNQNYMEDESDFFSWDLIMKNTVRLPSLEQSTEGKIMPRH
jgi:hypothetical protein